MCQRHRNQTVPVFRPWTGVSDRIAYYTTEEKARRLVDTHRAILRDPNKGISGGIERVAESRNLKDPARTESYAVRSAHVASGEETEIASPFEIAEYFRSLSPYRWARQQRRT
jgi:hypothetical protein